MKNQDKVKVEGQVTFADGKWLLAFEVTVDERACVLPEAMVARGMMPSLEHTLKASALKVRRMVHADAVGYVNEPDEILGRAKQAAPPAAAKPQVAGKPKPSRATPPEADLDDVETSPATQ